MDYESAAKQQQGGKLPVGYERYDNPNANNAKPAPPDTPLNRLLLALDSLESAAATVSLTTDSLCGSQPQPGEKASQDPAPSGMFAAISVSANRVERIANFINECMNRIQRVAG